MHATIQMFGCKFPCPTHLLVDSFCCICRIFCFFMYRIQVPLKEDTHTHAQQQTKKWQRKEVVMRVNSYLVFTHNTRQEGSIKYSYNNEFFWYKMLLITGNVPRSPVEFLSLCSYNWYNYIKERNQEKQFLWCASSIQLRKNVVGAEII